MHTSHPPLPSPLQLDPWKLETDDTKLLDLMPFLEAIVQAGVPDVRDVVRSYDGLDIPTAFKCVRATSATSAGIHVFPGNCVSRSLVCLGCWLDGDRAPCITE
jgi:hypothetical protein